MSASESRDRVVDMLGIAYDRECWDAYLRWYADGAPGYLRVLGRRLCALAGTDHEAYAAALDRGPHAAVDALMAGGRLGLDLAAHARELRDQGVNRQVIAGCPMPLSGGGTVNDRIAALAAPHGDVLTTWAGLSLADPDGAVAELRRCVAELGMTGAVLTHFFDDVDPLATEVDRVYAEAESLGVPLWIHTGHNLSARASVATCTWRELDEIARRHPDLRIVAGHGGWPWVLEMVALCQRHRHVYLELSTHRAPHMAAAGSGWEPLLCYGATTIRRKVLFGSCEWVHGRSVRALADEYRELPLDAATRRLWLAGNAAALLDRQRGR